MKTLLSNAWLPRDLGFLYWVADASRCKRLLESVEVTFMDEAVPLSSACFCVLHVPTHLVLSVAIILPSVALFSFLKFKYTALDSDDLLYLKEQMEAEEDAERLLRRTEKRAFAAFKRAATLADSSPASVPLPLRVEPKPKSGIRQQDLLKKVVEIKPKRQKLSSPSDGNQSTSVHSDAIVTNSQSESDKLKDKGRQPLLESKKVEEQPSSVSQEAEEKTRMDNPAGGLLGLAYTSSDDEE